MRTRLPKLPIYHMRMRMPVLSVLYSGASLRAAESYRPRGAPPVLPAPGNELGPEEAPMVPVRVVEERSGDVNADDCPVLCDEALRAEVFPWYTPFPGRYASQTVAGLYQAIPNGLLM